MAATRIQRSRAGIIVVIGLMKQLNSSGFKFSNETSAESRQIIPWGSSVCRSAGAWRVCSFASFDRWIIGPDEQSCRFYISRQLDVTAHLLLALWTVSHMWSDDTAVGPHRPHMPPPLRSCVERHCSSKRPDLYRLKWVTLHVLDVRLTHVFVSFSRPSADLSRPPSMPCAWGEISLSSKEAGSVRKY